MFDEEMLSLFAQRESAFVFSKKLSNGPQQAWNRVLDAKDVIESKKAMYGEPNDKALESLYLQLEKLLKEFSNGNKTEEGKGT